MRGRSSWRGGAVRMARGASGVRGARAPPVSTSPSQAAPEKASWAAAAASSPARAPPLAASSAARGARSPAAQSRAAAAAWTRTRAGASPTRGCRSGRGSSPGARPGGGIQRVQGEVSSGRGLHLGRVELLALRLELGLERLAPRGATARSGLLLGARSGGAAPRRRRASKSC